MNTLRRTIDKFRHDTRGASLLGYALLISVVLGAAYLGMGYQTGTGTWEPPTLITLPKWSPM